MEQDGPQHEADLNPCSKENNVWFLQHINIYAFSRHFYPKRLTVRSGYTFFCQYVCSLGIEPTMLYHWATGTYARHLYISMGQFFWKVIADPLQFKTVSPIRTKALFTVMDDRNKDQTWKSISAFRFSFLLLCSVIHATRRMDVIYI